MGSFWLFGQLMRSEHVYVSFGFDTMPTLVGLVLILQFIMAPINVVLTVRCPVSLLRCGRR